MHCPPLNAPDLPAWLATLVLLAPTAGAQRQTSPHRPHPRPARGTFEIVSCSLGCVPGPSGLNCGTSAIHENEVLRITFNQPVALASAGPNTFLVLDVTGNSPPATFALDPRDPNTLVWRPQIAFDSGGNPLFGLLPSHAYLLRLPGTDQDPFGPFLTSLDGLPNRTRLQCVLVASLGVMDLVPGRPLAKIFVQVVALAPLSGQPSGVVTVPAEGATGVSRGSPIEIVFDDFMNPATVANPVTGQSSFIRIFFDPDGNLQDVSDQFPIKGFFALSIDPVRNETRARFQATDGFPTSGPGQSGRVLVTLSPQIVDLGGNTLANPGTTSFATE